MKILFVEDNNTFANDLQPSLADLDNVSLIDRFIYATDAIDAAKKNLYDIVILDLAIPYTKGDEKEEKEHGQAVFHEIQTNLPHTPILILTASDPDQFTTKLVRYGHKIPIWGSREEVNTVDYFKKEETLELIERVRYLAGILAETNAVSLDTRGKDLSLSLQQTRAIKAFTRSAGGVSCGVSDLSGGLSSTRVLRTIARDEQGKALAVCAGKLGRIDDVRKEIDAYERHVKRLGIGAFSPAFCVLNQGLGQSAGIFYTLAEGDISLFSSIKSDLDTSLKAIDGVMHALDRWTQAAVNQSIKIQELRRRSLSDEALDRLREEFDLSFIDKVEERTVRTAVSCVHGDLHGGNVLVGKEGNPVIIDFGDVGEGYAALDPVTLELSLIFHPEAQRLELNQCLVDLIEKWPAVDDYVQNNPYEKFINKCREWAHDVAAGDLDVLACAYAFVLRQLKYKTVDSATTLKLLHSICQKISRLY
ncbi:hypothetical protein BS627_01180 [Agrobacterium salinitolerans]|uniref:phosphotransferase n=1 Tax=Agrobacterium salinitolerans TaxID=1183413 RepID=UPI00098EDFFF|nr:phosphotransferase [Agrobacterium salinitolerans]OOO28801.1 hypothetical protein BS627_01180 [Agrobacterium salinitolerans]PNQ26356.1 hypothetical protein C2E26_01200 [Rhizobium sp. YIC5082]